MKPILADGGHAALALMEQARDNAAPFSLVLLDALMPEIDGFIVAERIKANPDMAGTVLLMVTSCDRQGFADRVQGTRIAGCLYKPIRQSELRAAILAAVGPTLRTDGPTGPVDAPLLRPRAVALRILMAEDNPFNQRVAGLMLAKLGHVVTVAVNGHEAVAALRRQSFDLVLMDLQMPVMGGLEASAAIRAAESGTAHHVPIIALTAHALKEDRVRCLEAGMDGYVSKPIQQDKLRQAIDECVFRIGGNGAAEPPEGQSESPMDVTSALARVDGDRVFLGEMAAMFRDKAPQLLAEAKAGIESADAVRTGKAVHVLKNWIVNFVAPPAFAAVQALEAAAKADDLAAAGGHLAALSHQLQRLAPGLNRLASNPERAEAVGRPGKNQRARAETSTH
jgi:two-component system, sensor histidine kinase and response regulator